MWYGYKGSSKQYPLTIARVKEIQKLNKEGKKPDELQPVELETNTNKAGLKVEMGFVNDVGQITLKTLEKNNKKKGSSRSQQSSSQPKGTSNQQKATQQKQTQANQQTSPQAPKQGQQARQGHTQQQQKNQKQGSSKPQPRNNRPQPKQSAK